MKNRLPLTLAPLAALALLALLFAGSLTDPRASGSIDSPLLGKTVPALPTKIEPPYVVNFFASWCTPCVLEHPYLKKLQQENIRIIGIAYKDKKDKIDAFLERGGNPYADIVYDETGETGINFGITGVPESFIVNAQGIITQRLQGPIADDAVFEDFKKSLP